MAISHVFVVKAALLLLDMLLVSLQDLAPCQPWHNGTCVACLNEQLTMTCPQNHTLIGFVHAGFRASKDPDCLPDPEDCFADPVPLMTQIFRCMWKKSGCVFTLKPHHFPRGDLCDFSHTPHYLMTSQTSCVPDGELHAICQDTDRRRTIDSDVTGYITSPNFPQPYSQNRRFHFEDCWLILEQTPYHGLCLDSMAMDLPRRDTQTHVCSADYVQITWQKTSAPSDELASSVYCADDVISLCVFSTDVTVLFVITLENHVRHGFAIRYNRVEAAAVSETSSPLEHTATVPATSGQTLLTKVVVAVLLSLLLLGAVVMVTVCVVCVRRHRAKQLHGSRQQAGVSGVRFVTLIDNAPEAGNDTFDGHM